MCIDSIYNIESEISSTYSCVESTSMNEATNIKIYRSVSSISTENSASKNKENDVRLWRDLSKDDIFYWVEKGLSECQDSNGSLKNLKKLFARQTLLIKLALSQMG